MRTALRAPASTELSASDSLLLCQARTARAHATLDAVERRLAQRATRPRTPADEVSARVAALREVDPALSIEAAAGRVFAADPVLYATYRDQPGGAASTPAPAPGPPAAAAEVDRRVNQALLDDPSLTVETAAARVFRAHPALYQQYARR